MVTMPFSCHERHTQLVWTVLECLCFSGLLYGWNILTPVLKTDGLYATYCEPQFTPNDSDYQNSSIDDPLSTNMINNSTNKSLGLGTGNGNVSGFDFTITRIEWQAMVEEHLKWQYMMLTFPPTCQTQEIYLRTVQIVAVCVVGVLMLPFGYMFDHCGTLKLRILAVFLFAGSTIIMAFTSQGKAWLLYLATIFLGLSGMLILLTNLQVANLFKYYQAAAVLIYHGACDSSAFILLLVKHSADTGLNFQSSFMFLTVGVVPILIGTIAFLPKTRIPWPLPPHYHRRKTSFDEWFCEKPGENRRKVKFRSLLLSPPLLGQLLWFSVLQLRINLFSTTHTTWLRTITPDSSAVSSYSHTYTISQLFGIFVAVLAVLVLLRKTRSQQGEQSLEPEVATCLITYSVIFVMAVTFSICTLVLWTEIQYPVYILQLCIRVLLHGSNSIFLIICYPFEHFGKLLGLTHSVSAVLGLIQLPLSYLTDAEPESLKVINSLILVVVLTTSVQIFIIWKRRGSIIHSSSSRRAAATSRRVTDNTLVDLEYTPKRVIRASSSSPDCDVGSSI